MSGRPPKGSPAGRPSYICPIGHNNRQPAFVSRPASRRRTIHVGPTPAHPRIRPGFRDDPGRASARGRKSRSDSRIVQHPLGVIGFADNRSGAEQRTVETDVFFELVHRDVDMQSFHRQCSRMDSLKRKGIWLQAARSVSCESPLVPMGGSGSHGINAQRGDNSSATRRMNGISQRPRSASSGSPVPLASRLWLITQA